MRRRVHALCTLIVAAAASGGGCGGVGADEPGAPLGAQSREELFAAIEGHADPIAAFLREEAGEEGTLAGDYRDVLRGMGHFLGCDAGTDRSFVVLTNQLYIPKIVFASCADDPRRASRFLMNAPEVATDGDMDPRVVHMAAWDDEAGAYRHYETRPDGDEMAVRVAPDYCMHCHGGRFGRDSWMPLMNEMVAPWSQWRAEPEADSQLFHEDLDPAIADGETYREMTGEAFVASAAELEPIVRAGIDRVAGAQLGRRDEERGARAALELVRPLFCDEELDYVSEFHESGEIPLAAALDPNLGALFSLAAPDEAWPWLGRSRLRLPAAEKIERLTLVPVRAELSTTIERGLVSRGVLSAEAALRVRALDWSRPALSPFRCDLYRRGLERIDAGDTAMAIPEDAAAAELVPVIVRELLHIAAPDGSLVALQPDSGDLVAIADAEDAAVAEELAAGDVGAFEVSYAELAAAVQERVDSLESVAGREELAAARRELACDAQHAYPTAPLYPDRICD